MPNKKPANKISKGRTPKPAANNIKDVNKSLLKGELKNMQNRLSAVRNKLPVGANAKNSVYNRGRMPGGTAATVALGASLPVADKVGRSLGTKLGKSLKPVGRAIDKTLGTKPKKKSK
jgi:hypothetical protein